MQQLLSQRIAGASAAFIREILKLAEAGYKNVCSVVDGFEGDKAKEGPNKGQRVVNGWKNTNLPWSYKLDKEKMYWEM